MKRLLPLLALVLLAMALFTPQTCHAQAVLRVGDTVEVRVGGVPTEEITACSGVQVIDDAGNLNIPYIGKIKVVGSDCAQAQQSIESKLVSEKIYTNPTITVTVQAVTRFVNVSGEVKAPGRVQYTADMTVMSAIAAASGFSDFADQKHVKLVRAGKVQVLNTTKFTRDPAQDIKVLPGDQLVVPQSSGFPSIFN